MRDSIKEMACRMDKLGMSWQDVAGKAGKDRVTAIRQLSEESNPTIDTLEQYAAALGGSIHFLPDDWSEGIKDVEYVNKEIARMNESIGALRKENEMLRERIEKQDALLEKRLVRINELQELLTKVIEKLMEKI